MEAVEGIFSEIAASALRFSFRLFVSMVREMQLLFGLLFVVGAGILWFAMSKRKASADPTQKHLARLLLVCARALSDRNYELYSATLREIINIMRNERCERADVERRIRHALSVARTTSTQENFEQARRLAQNIIQAST